MNKRMTAMFLAIAMLCALLPATLLPASAEAYFGTCGDNLFWSFNAATGTLTIIGSGTMTNWPTEYGVPWYSIRDEIITVDLPDGLTRIDDYAFCCCGKLTDITIPGSVTSIGKEAFCGCSSLTSVTIPDSVTSIGNNAFSACGLTSLILPDSVKSIGEWAFGGNRSLTSVTIPGSVTSIGACAFSDCSNLTSVTIGNGLTGIRNSMFENCSSLTSITIPDSVTWIGDRAFSGCTWLESIKLPDGMTDIGIDAFYNCRSLMNITIPDSVMFFGDSAFRNCSSLTSITIPDGVTSIPENAFLGCSSLMSVYFYGAAPNVYLHAFSLFVRSEYDWAINYGKYIDIPGLTLYYIDGKAGWTTPTWWSYTTATWDPSAEQPYAVGTCGDNLTWSYYDSMKTLTITGTGEMEDYGVGEAPWFPLWKVIEKVNLPDGLTSIGDWAFSGCRKLTSITIPDSVTDIGNGAFEDCGLTSIVIPNSVTSIGYDTFHFCVSLTSVTLPDSVTSIGDRAFSYCTGLTSVTIPDSVTSIGGGAFEFCTGLTSVTIPDSVTSIGGGAFEFCTGLTSIKIPFGVTSIGDGAFSCCSSLTGITVDENNPFYCNDEYGVLYNKDKSYLLCCPASYSGAYMIPSGVTGIGDDAFRDCTGLTGLTILPGVTDIGDFSFYNCSSLTSVVIPDSVTSIGWYVFGACNSLTSVTIMSGLTSIGVSAFSGCRKLTSITVDENNPSYSNDANGVLFNKDKTEVLCCPGSYSGSYSIPSGVTTIGVDAFNSCDKLTGVTIPHGVTTIGDHAFEFCNSLTSVTSEDSSVPEYRRSSVRAATSESVTIPDSVTTIGVDAFAYCSGLTSVTIPDSVTSIGGGAFEGCSNLMRITVDENNPFYSSDENGVLFNKDKTELLCCPAGYSGDYTIPDGVTTIGNTAFSGCSSLTSVTIPDSVTSIGKLAFNDCTGLTSIYFCGAAPSLGDNAFVWDDEPGDPVLTLYYIEGKEGWTTPEWNGYPTATWLPKEPTDPEDGDENVVFNSMRMILSGDLGVTFPVKVPESMVSAMDDAYMKVVMGSEESIIPFADAVYDENLGVYNFTYYINSLQMAQTITPTFCYGDKEICPGSKSVQTYINDLIGIYAENAKLVALLKSIANYGHYAQLALQEVYGFSLGEDGKYQTMTNYDDIALPQTEQLAAYKATKNGSIVGISDVSRSLALDHGTDILLFFTCEDGYAPTVTVTDKDGNAVTCTLTMEQTGKYCLTIPSISAHMLGDFYTVSVDDGEMTIDICALSYAYSVLKNATATDAQKNAVAALYYYYEAAASYLTADN